MIRVPGSFRAMPRWGHDAPGREWLDRLPGLVDQQCRCWRLTVAAVPAHGSNALVVPVARDGVPLALRLAPPGDDVGALADALTLWAGRGTALLRDADPARGALLLERLDGAASLAREPLAYAVGVLAELTRTLAVPVPADVPGTDRLAAALADTLAADCADLGDPLPARHLDRVLFAAGARAAAGAGALATNGDLHHDQVLRGTRSPWLVVDPVLLRGDPEYDLARVLWTRLDEMAEDRDIRAAFDRFVRTAAVPPDRARDWVLIRAASYLVWGARHGLTQDPPRCLRLIAAFA